MSPYIPPGVEITETVTSQVSPQLASASDVCLVGPTFGYLKVTETFLLGNTEAIVIPFLAALPEAIKATLIAVTSVENAEYPRLPEGSEGKGYKVTRDYVVNLEKGTIKREAYGSGGSEGKIKENTLVTVTFEYVPADYFNPKRFFNLFEVQNRYGNAWDPTNTFVYSPLSMAALKAFQNGAQSVLCQPLFKTTTVPVVYNSNGLIVGAERPEPEDIAKSTTWSTSFEALKGEEEFDLLVPVVGQGQGTGEVAKEQTYHVNDASMVAIFGALFGFEQELNGEEHFIFGVLGEDASGNKKEATAATVRSHAKTLEAYQGGVLNAQNIMINTANFTINQPQSNLTTEVGGQYMAAAVAGAMAAQPVSSSLTRRGLIGFNSVRDLRTPAEKNTDAETGLMVIEQKKSEILCRAALTMDTTGGSSRSQPSVTRAKFLMVESVKKTLENQIIGKIIADGNSPIIVRSAISGVLAQLQAVRYLVSYTPPVCQISTLNPATITASFSYRPSFTVEYIKVNFSLDLTNGTVTSEETTNIIPSV
jgi:hypothetical protein